LTAKGRILRVTDFREFSKRKNLTESADFVKTQKFIEHHEEWNSEDP